MRISMNQASDQFLNTYSKDHAPGTVRQVRIAIEKFRKESKVEWLDAVSHFHVKQFMATHSRQQISALRIFLQACKEAYGNAGPISVPVPPILRTPSRPAISFPPKRRDKPRLWVAHTNAAAERMTFPHQKLVFLCGYLYGLPLAKVVRMALKDLCDLPMRQDFYELLEGMRYMLPAGGPAFKPWLGRSVVYARRVWRDWSGGVPFTEIVCAGDAARLEAGIRPVSGRKHRNEMLDLLPPASPVLLDRMPKLWAA